MTPKDSTNAWPEATTRVMGIGAKLDRRHRMTPMNDHENSTAPLEVRTAATRRERRIFLSFPWRIYAGDPLWVPPMYAERKKTIDPRRGVFFRRGTAEMFIAWRGNRPLGTICAAEDRTYNARMATRECMFGFFECVDDPSVAAALLHRAALWARERGLETLIGPFNLDIEDAYGILVEGRDRPPSLLCGHTPAYYLPFF